MEGPDLQAGAGVEKREGVVSAGSQTTGNLIYIILTARKIFADPLQSQGK